MGDTMSVRITSFSVHKLSFFEHRRLFAFTSISERVYKELLRCGVYTMELRSANNINALLATQDNSIFVTDKSKEDIRRGMRGILGEIKNVSMMEHKNPYRDESEITVVRVQVETRGTAKATHIINHGTGKPLEVIVEEVIGCAAS